MKLRELIGGATNSADSYADVHLPQNVGVLGSPAADRTIDVFTVAAAAMFAGALAFRLWCAKGPGARKLQNESP